MDTALIVCAALLMDAALGEPRRFHPLVGFATVAQSIERRFYKDSVPTGLLALTVLLFPCFLFGILLAVLLPAVWVIAVSVVVLYLAIGWRSLELHAQAVRAALVQDDLSLARQRVGMIVSRQTDKLDRRQVAGATIESVLENGNDAVFGAIFWFAVAGLPGVLLYRLSNTLDAMWGYRNERYLHFGRAAARLDDVLNWIPARLTALSYAVGGKTGNALRCWEMQGAAWKSSNAGSVMAAGAGSLGLLLGGSAVYDGVVESRPALGDGAPPEAEDIDGAVHLLRRTLLLWVLLLLAGGWVAVYVS